MLTIYGHPLSTCTRKVLTTLAENGTPHEFVLVDFAKGEHKVEPHLSRQPFGRVPALDDDGFRMFESRAMSRYLNERYEGSLRPADVQGRARMEQYISVETSEFSPHAMKFVYEYIFKRPQAEGVLDAAAKALDLTCGVLDARLGEAPFLAGETFSLADVFLMPYVGYASVTPAQEVFAKHPRFTAWWEKVSARPSWKKVAG